MSSDNQIFIYNTMTRSKEAFVPQEKGKVSMYVCGPTVYDYIHIGNARSMIFFDVVRRYFSLFYDVRFVVNFTDVDDKLIRKSQATGEPVADLAERFIAAYHDDARGLGVREADVHPRVTENMDEIISFIAGLIDKGAAYESGGDVYFRTSAFPDYGKLSGQNLEELKHGARVEKNEKKESAPDFALWKQAKPGEISWDSPWGKGRPGWHIECSTLVQKYLGHTIDIHGGGGDLVFPHHECEVAQSESLHGEPLARYWMHNGYINIDNEKMSKSLGNGVNVKDLRARYKPQALRYMMLATHYRNPLNFSENVMKQAEQSVARLDNCVSTLRFRQQLAAADVGVDDESAQLIEAADQLKHRFHAKMNDDFNTPDALTVMFDAVAAVNPYLQRDTVHADTVAKYLELFAYMDSVLGLLSFTGRSSDSYDDLVGSIHIPEAGPTDDEVERMIEEREKARRDRDFKRADDIRDQLASQGVVLEDTPQGTRWKRA